MAMGYRHYKRWLFVVSFFANEKKAHYLKHAEKQNGKMESEDIKMTEQEFMYEAKGQTLVIHLPKELDHHNCRNLKYETDLLLAENYITKIVFDFSGTVFMDSSGIGVLLNRYKQMERSGGKVAICGAGAQILRVLTIGGMGKLVPRYNSMEEAIAG